MSQFEHIQCFQKAVIGYDADNGDPWEVTRHFVSDFISGLKELEPDGVLTSGSIFTQFTLNQTKLLIYRKDGKIFAKQDYRAGGSSSIIVCQVVDQDDNVVLQSTNHPFELDHDVIVDLKRNILRDKETLVVDVYTSNPFARAGRHGFIPRNKASENILNLLLSDQETADISFEIKGACNYNFSNEDELNNSLNIHALFGNELDCDSLRSGLVIFAHLCIVKASSPMLANLCKGYDNYHPVPITGVDPEIFQDVLSYLYGGKIPVSKLRRRPQAYIDAADRFAITDLKIEAEVRFVRSGRIDIESVLDIYQYAVSKNCALMQEMAEDYIISHGQEILGSPSVRKKLKEMPELALELLELVTSRLPAFGHNGRDCGQSVVDRLRRKLHENGLDIDGTWEMLTGRLNDNGLTSNEDEVEW